MLLDKVMDIPFSDTTTTVTQRNVTVFGERMGTTSIVTSGLGRATGHATKVTLLLCLRQLLLHLQLNAFQTQLPEMQEGTPFPLLG